MEKLKLYVFTANIMWGGGQYTIAANNMEEAWEIAEKEKCSCYDPKYPKKNQNPVEVEGVFATGEPRLISDLTYTWEE